MAKLTTFPVSLKVSGRRALIVGGGDEALNKARLLTKSEVSIIVVAPEVDPDLAALAQEVHARDVLESDFEDLAFVFVATEDHDERERAVQFARAKHVLLNVVDVPHLCDFYTPAIVDRAPLAVAISTEGMAPVLARFVRSKIETLFSPKFGEVAEIAGRLRDRVSSLIADGDARRRYYQDLVTSSAVARALDHGADAAQQAAEDLLAEHAAKDGKVGEVWLIGAGPGAEDLLTLRAQRLLQEADVIVYDQLVPDIVVQMGRRDAQRISVGKSKGKASTKQNDINALIVKLAKKNLKVARLKSGDPMVFGRAHEEMEALRDADVPFQIVSGVTSGLAAAADSEIPMTLRGVSSGIVFVTAHGANNSDLHHWASLAQAKITLGIYMGKSVMKRTADALVEAGLSPSIPVGVITNAGRFEAQRVVGTLGDMQAETIDLSAGPAIIFVGESVGYGNWTAQLEPSSKEENAQ